MSGVTSPAVPPTQMGESTLEGKNKPSATLCSGVLQEMILRVMLTHTGTLTRGAVNLTF